jgi:hypothetical protein
MSSIASNSVLVGFYNLENLFDPVNQPNVLDDDFTPEGSKHWTPERYEKKLRHVGKTISSLGSLSDVDYPVLMGVAELENDRVLDDLLEMESLKKNGMDFIHYDSPDERGIDTALLFHRDFFEPEHCEPIPLLLFNEDGSRDYTRDITYVRGNLNGERLHVFVNHWPSRRDGAMETVAKRITAASTILSFMEVLEEEEENPNYLIMGDFNDGPGSESIQHLLAGKPLFNPMHTLISPDRGTAKYKGEWSIFDQILISHTLLQIAPGTHSFDQANIFDAHFLQEWKQPYKGKPFRTFAGQKYLGGYSDHFPVYMLLNYHH